MNLVPPIVKQRLDAMFGKDDVEKIANAFDEMGDEAKEANLEFKDVAEGTAEGVETEEKAETVVEAEAEVEAKEQTEEQEVESESADSKSADSKSADSKSAESEDEPLNRKEVEDAMKAISTALSTLTDAIKTLDASHATVADELKAVSERLDALEKEDEEKVARLAAETPRASRASLADLIQMSVIGKEVAHVDGRKARHEGPEETKVSKVSTGHPMMDTAITDIVGGSVDVFGVQGGQ